MKSALSSKEILNQDVMARGVKVCAEVAATFLKWPLFDKGRSRVGMELAYCVFAQPITPQAMRAPASPDGWVFRSSGFACTTTDRPIADLASFVSEIW